MQQTQKNFQIYQKYLIDKYGRHYLKLNIERIVFKTVAKHYVDWLAYFMNYKLTPLLPTL